MYIVIVFVVVENASYMYALWNGIYTTIIIHNCLWAKQICREILTCCTCTCFVLVFNYKGMQKHYETWMCSLGESTFTSDHYCQLVLIHTHNTNDRYWGWNVTACGGPVMDRGSWTETRPQHHLNSIRTGKAFPWTNVLVYTCTCTYVAHVHVECSI